MTDPDAMRASTQDRERISELLQQQVGEGRLTLAEFEERSKAAYAATTIGELRELVHDLPVDAFPTSAPEAFWPMPLGNANISQHQRSFSPARHRHPVFTVVLALFAVLALADVVGAALWGLPIVFPILMGMFILVRISRVGRWQYPRH